MNNKRLKLFIVVLIALLLLFVCDSEENVIEEPETEQSLRAPVKGSLERARREKESSDKAYKEYTPRSERVRTATEIISKAFGDIAEVEYNSSENMIAITPTSDEFKREVYTTETSGENIDDWNRLVESTTSLSGTVSDLVDDGIKVSIINPESQNRALLIVEDGEVIYDFAE